MADYPNESSPVNAHERDPRNFPLMKTWGQDLEGPSAAMRAEGHSKLRRGEGTSSPEAEFQHAVSEVVSGASKSRREEYDAQRGFSFEKAIKGKVPLPKKRPK